MELVRESSCVRERHYRTELPCTCSFERLTDALLSAGWRDESCLEGMLKLKSSNGHHLLIVTGTRRVQIRVAYAIPELERRWAAESVFVELVGIVQEED